MKQTTIYDAIAQEEDLKIYLEEMPLGWTWVDDHDRTWIWTDKGWVKIT